MPTGAALKRGQSRQDIETPADLLEAVVGRYGPLAVDLACQLETAKAPRYITKDMDSFKQCWADELAGGLGWLNPPFDPIAPWVRKCAAEAALGARILLLCRASVDANWWWADVWPHAHINVLTPRVTFVGAKDVYPSALVLATYNLDTPASMERWRWK